MRAGALDCVVTESGVGSASGIEFVGQTRERDGHLPIVLIGHAPFVNGPVDVPSELTVEVDALNCAAPRR